MNLSLDYKIFSETFAEQYPEKSEISDAISLLGPGIWESPAYLRFVYSMNANQTLSDWQHKECIVVTCDLWGDIVIDLLSENVIGGFEFLRYAHTSDWSEFEVNDSIIIQKRGRIIIGDVLRGSVKSGNTILFTGRSQIYSCVIGGIEFVDNISRPIDTRVALTLFHLPKDFFASDLQINPQTALVLP